MFWGAGFGTVFLIALVVSFLQYRLIVFKSVEIVPHVPLEPVECGSTVEVRYEVKRSFPVLPGCIIDVGMDFDWHDRKLEGHRSFSDREQHGTILIKADRRGEYITRGVYLNMKDAAGFFNYRYFSTGEQKLTVKPAGIRYEQMPHIMKTGGENVSRMMKKKRSDEFLESRQYFPGDDVRRINWKTYAHLGELFIRLGEELPEPDSRIIIIPDLSGDAEKILGSVAAGRYLDYYVNCLSGIIERFNSAGVAVELSAAGGVKPVEPQKILPGLWWNDAAGTGASGENGNLLFCSAFSSRAEQLCKAVAGAGRPINVIIPVMPGPDAVGRKDAIRKILFGSRDNDFEDHKASDTIRTASGYLISKLSGLKGVVDATIL